MSIAQGTATFDAEEQEILKALKPEDDAVIEVPEGAQPASTEGGTPAASAAPAPEAAPAQTAAAAPADPASAPAPTTAPVQAAAPAAAEPAQPAASTATAAAEPEKPQGDVRGALRASRQAERRLREEIKRRDEELEALRAGKAPVDTNVNAEELERLEADFPAVAKVVRQSQALQRELQELKATRQPDGGTDGFVPVEYEPHVQEVIDEVPDLLNWQHDPKAQDKFQRAVSYDAALFADPDWKDKTPVERFAEAARRTRVAFGLQPASGQPSPSGPAPAQPQAPAAPDVTKLPVEGPKGISDFRGGAPATAPTLDYSRMSDEAVMASLKPMD